MSGQDNSAADATGTQEYWDWFRNVGFLKVDKPCWRPLEHVFVCVCVYVCVHACFLSEWRNSTIFLVSCLLLSDHLSASRCLLDCCWCVWDIVCVCVCVCVCVILFWCFSLSACPSSSECDCMRSHSFSLSLRVNFNIYYSSYVPFFSTRVFLLLFMFHVPPLICMCVHCV